MFHYPLSVMMHWIAIRMAIGAGVLLVFAGCAQMPLAQKKSSAVDVRLVQDSYQGPTERAASERRWAIRKSSAAEGGQSIPGLDQYNAAEALYDDGRFAEAEKAFAALAKARRNTYEDFNMRMERWWGVRNKAYDTYSTFGDPIEEDALFMKAECQFAQQRYAAAQDAYGYLLTKYPSTRHLDKVSRRHFQIAQQWLGFDGEVADNGEIRQVSGENGASPPKEFKDNDPFYVPVIPNFTDKTRPVFDTRGRALQALRSIWLHDPTGPLADDALMLSASFHLRTQDFEESARLYKMLREQYPDSPHFRDAFLLGSHVTLASYQGSNYDDSSLGEAIELKESALRIFPDLTEDERNRLGSELNLMHEAEIARIWDRVEFFQAKNSPESVAVYCKILINRFPDSEYANRARQILQHQAGRQQYFMQARQRAAEEATAEADIDSQSVETDDQLAKPRLFPALRWPSRVVPAPEQNLEEQTTVAPESAGAATLD